MGTGSQSSITVTPPSNPRPRGGMAVAAMYFDSGGAGPTGYPGSPWESYPGNGLGGLAVQQLGYGMNSFRPSPGNAVWSAGRNDNWVGMMLLVE